MPSLDFIVIYINISPKFVLQKPDTVCVFVVISIDCTFLQVSPM